MPPRAKCSWTSMIRRLTCYRAVKLSTRSAQKTGRLRQCRKRIDCAPSTQRPDIVMGWLVHRDAFGGAVSTWPSPLLKHCPQLFEALHLSTRLVLPIYPGGNAREGSLWLSEDKVATTKFEVKWLV